MQTCWSRSVPPSKSTRTGSRASPRWRRRPSRRRSRRHARVCRPSRRARSSPRPPGRSPGPQRGRRRSTSSWPSSSISGRSTCEPAAGHSVSDLNGRASGWHRTHGRLHDGYAGASSRLNILVPFVTTLATLPTTAGPAVEDALLRYFFTPQGFETVDGLRVVAPVHLADIDVANLGQFKALFSERTGERYVRDLVRLTVEAAGDVRYDDLKSRYGAMLQLVGDDAKRTTFTNWFKGFASIAEAALTSAVEQACLGAASFQTNALIAASAGTFAGTAARKAAQHVFLSELEYL